VKDVLCLARWVFVRTQRVVAMEKHALRTSKVILSILGFGLSGDVCTQCVHLGPRFRWKSQMGS